jgi:hypothetical protein
VLRGGETRFVAAGWLDEHTVLAVGDSAPAGEQRVYVGPVRRHGFSDEATDEAIGRGSVCVTVWVCGCVGVWVCGGGGGCGHLSAARV